jgi:hypothetical protein
VVSAEKQREALTLILETAFRDESYGLTPHLLQHMTLDKWWDDWSSTLEDPTWPVHDMIMSIQSSMLVSLLHPMTLGRVYDNEFMVPADEDAVTLPELLNAVTKEIWSELNAPVDEDFSARKPMISSLRRNLQRQHILFLMDLTRSGFFSSAAYQAVGNLVAEQQRQIKGQVDSLLASSSDRLDPYTRAHLKDISLQIERALKAQMVVRSL